MITKICIICNKKFKVRPSIAFKRRCCSRKCKGIAWRGRIPWNKGKKLHYPVWHKGKILPRGEKHFNWKGGRRKHSAGYVIIYSPTHPYRDKFNDAIYEHRLVIEKRIGRYLRPEESVHHINGIKNDNRDENLLHFETESAHQKFHHSIK